MADVIDIPTRPPKEWFTTLPPGWDGTTAKKHIGGDGRVAIRYFTWDQCLEEGKGVCWKPEPSRNDYQMFHQGTILTAEGEEIPVGAIGVGGGHPKLDLDAKAAAAVYAETKNQRLVGTLVEDDIGGIFLGSLVPGLTEEQVAELRRSPVSADFRWRERAPDLTNGGTFSGYDNIGPWFVTKTAFPQAKAAALATIEADSTEHQARLTIPLAGDEELCCPECEHAARLAALGEVGNLKVGVDGFEGFDEAPIGEQLDRLPEHLRTPSASAPGSPDPMIMGRIEELEDRMAMLEQAMTAALLARAEAPELLLTAKNDIKIEEVSA